MHIVTVDGRDPDMFRRFFQVKDAVRREELERMAGGAEFIASLSEG